MRALAQSWRICRSKTSARAGRSAGARRKGEPAESSGSGTIKEQETTATSRKSRSALTEKIEDPLAEEFPTGPEDVTGVPAVLARAIGPRKGEHDRRRKGPALWP